MIHLTAFIHEKAHVGDAWIGARSRVWQFASVIRAAVIGEDCNIGSCAIVDAARVGKGSTIGHGVSLNPGVVLFDNVFVGPNVTFCNDIWPRTLKGDFDIERLLTGDLVTTRVESGVSIGAGVTVLPGLTIGADAMIAAGATVDRDVPSANLFGRDGSIIPIDLVRARDVRRLRECSTS